jgi:hypothetical protein
VPLEESPRHLYALYVLNWTGGFCTSSLGLVVSVRPERTGGLYVLNRTGGLYVLSRTGG